MGRSMWGRRTIIRLFERCLIGDLVHSLPSAAKKLSLLMVRYILKPDSKLRASFAFLLALLILSFL